MERRGLRAGAALKLVSWNVAGQEERAREQAEALLAQAADLVALQEVRTGALDAWGSALHDAGLAHLADTTDRLDGRRSAVLIASCWPLEPIDPPPMPRPERFLSVRVDHPRQRFELHNAHAPAGKTFGLVKVETMEAIHAALGRRSETPRILCGDFNSPMLETADGETRTFAQFHPEHRERWDTAELAVIRGLAEFDLPDTFRELHGWERREYSWIHEASGRGARLDHVFASRSLNATECEYVHSLRESGLSDHSAVSAGFDGA